MGYNTGDTYEEKIFDICKDRGIIAIGSTRAGAAGSEPDLKFIHLGNEYKLEIKNNMNPDYGQKRIHFNPHNGLWDWATDDSVTAFYKELSLLDNIDKNFLPIWYSKRVKNIKGRYSALSTYTLDDFKTDQSTFENAGNKVPTQTLFNYYAKRETYYIQIEGSGFYHLKQDVAGLGTVQYDGTLTMRFRVKHAGHSKNPPHACQFMGVLKQETLPSVSKFNIEPSLSQTFPNILNR
jgi:hypothetical protein